MEQNDLSGVKVGDKLFHVRYGWCEVLKIDRGHIYSIGTSLPNPSIGAFTFEGKEWKNDALPTLFLSKPTIIYPPPPVEKEVKGWVGFYRSTNGQVTATGLWNTEGEANFYVEGYYERKDPSIPRAVLVCHKYREEVKDE